MEHEVMAGCVFIDVEKLMTDIKVANVKFNDGISPSGRLGTIGLSFSTFHDAKKIRKFNMSLMTIHHMTDTE